MNTVMTHTPVKSQPLMALRGVAHQFGGLVVLRDVSFTVPRGRIAGLIGPNGSGKTTLFNIASGFLRPANGQIFIDGRDITAASVQERSRQGLIRTFQTPKVFQHMSVRENIEMGLYATTGAGFLASMLATPGARGERARIRRDAQEVGERFGLGSHLNKRAGDLPAGQQRIVELARAYMTKPRLLLLDEPSSGLSSDEVELLRNWVSTLSNEGITVLLVSHDMGLMSVCDTVHALYFGKIIASGSMAAIQADPMVREAYLGG